MARGDEIEDSVQAQLAEIDRKFDRLERNTLAFFAVVILWILI